MKIALIKENKIPIDRRVPLTPEQCQILKKQYKNIEIVVQTSDIRCFADEDYRAAGFEIVDNIDDCDVLLGVKEVPIKNLLKDKTYFFFSHTSKEQPYNRGLLQSILDNGNTLVDYESLTNQKGVRVIAFGRYAGLVGAYNGILTYGKRKQLFDLKPAHQCFDMKEMWGEFKKIKLANTKIIVTGGGRVAKGAMETLDGMRIRKVSPNDFLTKEYQEAVYAQVQTADYHKTKDGSEFITKEFYADATNFEGDFTKYAQVANILIASAYWSPEAPVLFTPEQMKQDNFTIEVIADITCDIEGSIPSTKRPSTIDDPIYDYNPQTTDLETAFSNGKNISVMAVDNLPCELPRDASTDFGKELVDNVFPYFLGDDTIKMIERASIAQKGELGVHFKYLKNYLAS